MTLRLLLIVAVAALLALWWTAQLLTTEVCIGGQSVVAGEPVVVLPTVCT